MYLEHGFQTCPEHNGYNREIAGGINMQTEVIRNRTGNSSMESGIILIVKDGWLLAGDGSEAAAIILHPVERWHLTPGLMDIM